MKNVKAILFDLDGTLTDSGKGIMNSYAYTAEKMGVPVPDATELRTFIGPPLRVNLAKFLPSEKIEEAVPHYWYSMVDMRRAIDENAPYEGISKMLKAIKAMDRHCFIATTKRYDLAGQIVEQFGWASVFTSVYGANKDGTGAEKGGIIQRLLSEQQLDPAATIMIGDRHHDIDGAKKNGLRSIGVLWGYGSRQELEEAGADVLVETPSELVDLFS